MKAYRKAATIAAGVLAACIASGASATVTYTFQGQGDKTFTYDATRFVDKYVSLPASSFTSSSGNFDTVEFCFAGEQCGKIQNRTGYNFVADTDTIYIISAVKLPDAVSYVGQTFEFGTGTFGTVGRYESSRRYGPGTLVVNDGTLAAAVPEPASWAMMLGGFGLLGSALRRRNVAVTLA